jgi:putative nucleotidyltransferase with HDIG domain
MSQTTKLKLYMGLNILVGLLICGTGLFGIWNTNNYPSVIFFIALSVISESFVIQVSKDKYISMGFAVGLAAILTFSPSVAAIIAFLGSLLKIYSKEDSYYHLLNSSVSKRIFNGAVYAIGAWISGSVYQVFSQQLTFARIYDISITSLILTVLVYVCVNVCLTSGYEAIHQNKKIKVIFHEMDWVAKNILGISPVGMIMALAYQKSGWFMVVLILGPLIMARYSFKLYIEMKQQYFETIKTLSNALDAKDNYTNGHSLRVAAISEAIAKNMQMTTAQVETIKTAALLHDIGKIGIPDAIINKPGRLEMSEIYEIRRHPEIGEQILKDVRALKGIAKIVKHHHERYDGNGYPDSLRGDQIPIESAIIAVADAFDAMTSNRIYRMALTEEWAMNVIQGEKGLQFHPEVVDVFLKCANQFVVEAIEEREETC